MLQVLRGLKLKTDNIEYLRAANPPTSSFKRPKDIKGAPNYGPLAEFGKSNTSDKTISMAQFMAILEKYWDVNFDGATSDPSILYVYVKHKNRITNDESVTHQELLSAFCDWLPFSPVRTALIIVDVQVDFVTGSLKVGGASDIIPRINALRNNVRFDVIVHTLDWHPPGHCSFIESHNGKEFKVGDEVDLVSFGGKGTQALWPTHCVEGTNGSALASELDCPETDYSVCKGTSKFIDSYSGFLDNDRVSETGLRVFLMNQAVYNVYVVGIAYDYCVGSTALHAKEFGFRTTVVTDCAASVGENSKNAMDKQLQANGVIQTTSDELQREPFVRLKLASTGNIKTHGINVIRPKLMHNAFPGSG